MISLDAFFWFMIGFFGLIGVLRGWTKEVIASAGLLLSLFVIKTLGPDWATRVTQSLADPVEAERHQIYFLGFIHLFIAFFSYEGPVFAGKRVAERLRIRETFQDKVMGALVGAVNGYLIIGTLWALLEKRIIPTPEGNTLMARDVLTPYPFDAILRPGMEGIPESLVLEYLPFPFLEGAIPYLMVGAFLFVIVVMI